LVARVLPVGPLFLGVRPRRATHPSTFVPALTTKDRVAVALMATGWVLAFGTFWAWWLRPSHRTDWAGLVLNSLLLLYVTGTPAYFFVTIGRIRRVNPATPPPRVRVAFVVTRAPSERWSMVRGTLQAMLAQQYPLPYDVWLCDEDPDDGIRRWCEANNVRLSCRRGVDLYHRANWPRRTRCKEGNLAYFYDHWGYREYDVVAQLDCDHVPQPTYLAAMVRPFADPAIGYVAAPSVCDANAAASWSARGRLYREATWHGAIQLGHNAGLAPVCIGSHYAVRTRALREIGGLGPELAEDFSTTMLMCSAGWHGAFAIDADARGDGPLTFADMLTQEFQWSRSLTMMLYDLLPHHLYRFGPALRARFTYAVAYYPLLALTTATGLALPPIAVASERPWVHVNYVDFLARLATLSVWPLLLTLLLRRRGLLRPQSSPLVSWESALFILTRWPYVAWGVLAATLHTIRPKAITFKVTPKARSGLEPLPLRLIVPYVLIALTLATLARTGESRPAMVGYVFLCILGAACYAVAATAVPALHIFEAARAAGRRPVDVVCTARVPLLVGALSFVPLVVAAVPYPDYAIQAFKW
jgi:cellulose synthase/poly-beta-1,6-N-acetylglucosamine synthase-like glycosyltransferase